MSDTRHKVGGPDAITLTVCESCARNDRWQPLRERHYRAGGLCPGPIRDVIYARTDQPTAPTDPAPTAADAAESEA